MRLSNIKLYGKEMLLASISAIGVHEDKKSNCTPHINLGNGDHSYRLDMSVTEANDLIKQLREQIESSYNSGENGRVPDWYSLNEINPDLRLG